MPIAIRDCLMCMNVRWTIARNHSMCPQPGCVSCVSMRTTHIEIDLAYTSYLSNDEMCKRLVYIMDVYTTTGRSTGRHSDVVSCAQTSQMLKVSFKGSVSKDTLGDTGRIGAPTQAPTQGPAPRPITDPRNTKTIDFRLYDHEREKKLQEITDNVMSNYALAWKQERERERLRLPLLQWAANEAVHGE